jgi:predicted nucleic acid-binding Zn ribbon protein
MTYIYYDPETGDELEVMHSIKEDPVVTNTKTGNVMKRKVTGGIGVIYKGEGWVKGTEHNQKYLIDQEKDLIRGGEKKDPYAKHRDEPL